MKRQKKPAESAKSPSAKLCAEAVRSCLCFNLRVLTRGVKNIYDDELKPSGLNSGQLALLLALRLTAPTTKQALAETVHVDRTALTRNLLPLQRKGFVREWSGDDRRTRLVALTDKGSRAIVQAMPSWKKAQKKAKSIFGEAGLERLLDTVHEAIKRLGKNRE